MVVTYFCMQQDIPGSWPFSKRGLQNEDVLTQMFCDISIDGGDHWCPIGTQPTEGISANNTDGQEQEGGERNEDDVQEVWQESGSCCS